MESANDFYAARAALEWQLDMGVTEAIGDAPIDRFALANKAPVKKKAAALPDAPPAVDAAAVARGLAAKAPDLQALRAAIAGFPHCDLRKGARNLVFADGNPAADLMIIGEGPGRDEDGTGQPFAGRAGLLLDKMLAAIGLGRDSVYLANALPWRPPQDRDPTGDELTMLAPFLQRHIDLAAPKLLILMGNTPCQVVLGKGGIRRMRGTWTAADDVPVMPMVHPAYLLKNPAAKREAWADLLEIKARLAKAT